MVTFFPVGNIIAHQDNTQYYKSLADLERFEEHEFSLLQRPSNLCGMYRIQDL